MPQNEAPAARQKSAARPAVAPPDTSTPAEEFGGVIDTDVLGNIPVSLSVEVGRAMLRIKDLMRLSQGSVVELDRLAGEPLDLLVNNTVVAQGEVVLVNDRYGIRLTLVIPARDRVRSL
jgi:flagellar motor switch protein FliN/FliY